MSELRQLSSLWLTNLLCKKQSDHHQTLHVLNRKTRSKHSYDKKQDKASPEFWLATQAENIGLYCSIGIDVRRSQWRIYSKTRDQEPGF